MGMTNGAGGKPSLNQGRVPLLQMLRIELLDFQLAKMGEDLALA
jgi:hypothetical protein